MDNTIFAYSIGRIKSLETRMFGRARLESLTDSRDFQDCIRMLQDSPYSGYVSMSSYEDGLKSALEDFYREIYRLCPVKGIVDLFAVRYDGHNIKSLIKGRLCGADTSGMLINSGTIPVDALKNMMVKEDFRFLPTALKTHVEGALEVFKNSQDPQDIDIIIDSGIYKYIFEIAASSQLEYLTGIVKLMVDILNIKAFIRVKLQEKGREFLKKGFINGGNIGFNVFENNFNGSLENFADRIMHTDHFKWVKDSIGEYMRNGDLGSMEKYGDNYLIDYLKRGKYVSFGPEPVIAFIISKENEIRALRIILTGKKNNVSPGIIKERLRDTYV